MILKIVQTGEIVLRQFARPLSRDEILSQPVQELIVAMRDTMRDAPGVGLAAPQVGMPFQLAVIEDAQDYIDKLPPGQAAERKRVAVPFQAIVNPTLTIEAADEMHFFEGCLSLAGFTAIVPRALAVRVECLNERAEPVTIRAEGWYARILQHEIDHLHGKLYIDRMESRSFTTLDNFNRHWKDKSVADFRRAVRHK
ncbi:MAG: peptide deformylase [Bryobacteraceae bacterium]|jgi:peptide deformylase